jgi:hypothetical protein
MDIEPQPCFYIVTSLHTMSTDLLLMTTLATLLNASECNLLPIKQMAITIAT